jgi:hypothetical protein
VVSITPSVILEQTGTRNVHSEAYGRKLGRQWEDSSKLYGIQKVVSFVVIILGMEVAGQSPPRI